MTKRAIDLILPATIAILAGLCADLLLEAGLLATTIERDLVALIFGVCIGLMLAIWQHRVICAAQTRARRQAAREARRQRRRAGGRRG